ncbi:MAG: polyisoprenoid-binding protein [Verrucomicrobiae bacterium]|nr:polyisoprenoid-binding protein [Verrucomicrobiae bacterium]
MKRLFAPLFAATLLWNAAAFAEVQTFQIDPVHSTVQFKIRHFFSKVTGQFGNYEGTIVMDTADIAKSKVDATIKTGSIDTKSEKRDGHLKSPDFFDTEKFSTITFKSTAWKETAKDSYDVTGDLTMHGVTKPVTLHVKALGTGPAMGGVRGGWEATTTINRTDFGVSWNKAVEGGGTILGEEVEITLNVEGVLEK